MAKEGINYSIVMGDDAISKTYKLNAYPATYLIDKSDKIAVAYVGVVINWSLGKIRVRLEDPFLAH